MNHMLNTLAASGVYDEQKIHNKGSDLAKLLSINNLHMIINWIASECIAKVCFKRLDNIISKIDCVEWFEQVYSYVLEYLTYSFWNMM